MHCAFAAACAPRCLAADAARRWPAQEAEAPAPALTPDAAHGAGKASKKAAAKPRSAAKPKAAKAAAKSPAAKKAAAKPAGVAKKARTPKKAPKATPTPPAAAKASSSRHVVKEKAVWAANLLEFQTGATDRAARAKAHRRR